MSNPLNVRLPFEVANHATHYRAFPVGEAEIAWTPEAPAEVTFTFFADGDVTPWTLDRMAVLAAAGGTPLQVESFLVNAYLGCTYDHLVLHVYPWAETYVLAFLSREPIMRMLIRSYQVVDEAQESAIIARQIDQEYAALLRNEL